MGYFMKIKEAGLKKIVRSVIISIVLSDVSVTGMGSIWARLSGSQGRANFIRLYTFTHHIFMLVREQ